jgi:ribonucleotide reductase alpha subunit
VRDTVSARELWQRILETRMLTGEPYIHFIDTSNRQMPEFQKKLGLSIKQSNLCSEIIYQQTKTARLFVVYLLLIWSIMMSGKMMFYFS